MSHAELIDRYVSAIERRDLDAYAALFAEDAVGYHPLSPEPVRGREAIRASEAELFGAFSDIRIDVRTVLAAERTVAIEVVLSARNTGPLDLGDEQPLPATNRTINLPAVWICVLGEDGLIHETRDYLDAASFMAQLGVGEEAAAPA